MAPTSLTVSHTILAVCLFCSSLIKVRSSVFMPCWVGCVKDFHVLLSASEVSAFLNKTAQSPRSSSCWEFFST